MFDAWWEHAREHYIAWDGDRPTAVDLYYDPVIDHHHGRTPVGLSLPGWYLAPQRRPFAQAGWDLVGALATGGGAAVALRGNPQLALNVLQLGAEFAEPAVVEEIWEASDEALQPTWTADGRFWFGFGLDEPHPRGQLNARAAAARACTTGAWWRVFNEPNTSKFGEPTVSGVDFPRVALAEARWDAAASSLFLTPVIAPGDSPHTTTFEVTGLPGGARPVVRAENGREGTAELRDGRVVIGLIADGTRWSIRAGRPAG